MLKGAHNRRANTQQKWSTCRYYLGSASPSTTAIEDLQVSFKRQLHSKFQGTTARPDAAEVATVMGITAVFCGGMAVGATPSGGAGGVINNRTSQS